LQQSSGRLDRIDQPDAVHRAMAEVEFVFELLSPEPQERAEQLLQPPRRRLQPFQGTLLVLEYDTGRALSLDG
jgi:hypothetical protein